MQGRFWSHSQSGGVSTAATVALAALAIVSALLFWPEASVESEVASPTSAVAPADAVERLWTCSMHPEVLSDEPGRCPQCGMDLVPVDVAPSPAPGADRTVKYWRAPMDPTYVSDKPGKSPMGMDLVPVYEDAETGAGREVVVSPVVVQNMGVRTAPVERGPWVRALRTVGTIDYDERLVRDVTTRFDGWIEELYADYTGQFVREGMPLFRVYSRELYSTQEEYLLAVNNLHRIDAAVSAEAAADMRELVAATRERLRLFGVEASEIDALERRNAPSTSVTIHSPHSGLIVEKLVREGMRTSPGMRLYSVADLSRVWVNVDIFESEVPFVRIGQSAEMELSYLPGQTFEGRVIYVYPIVDAKSRTVRVRLEFDNAHHVLKPGMFANITIAARLEDEGLVIPRAAMIDTGARQVVFVARGEGRFESRDIRAGVELDEGRLAVLDGLAGGERVVVSGQFLLDSESKLREAILKMMDERRGVAEGAETVPAAVSPDAEHDHGGHAACHGEDSAAPADGAAPHEPSQPDLGFESAMAAYLDLQQALAADRYADLGDAVAALRSSLAVAGAAAHHPAVRRAVSAADGMAGRRIDSVRAQFTDLSAAFLEWMLAVRPGGDPRWHTFHCPMAGADWVQRDAEPKNPYYGFSMHSCGDAFDPVARVR